MQSSIATIFAALAVAATASVLPRAHGVVPANHCCFELKDTSSNGRTLQQAKSGQTYLSTSSSSSTNPYGWYCVNFSDKNKKTILFDDDNDACIIDSRGEFTCLDPIPGNTKWTLKDGNLAYDGKTGFKACKAQEGGQAVGSDGKSGSGCRSLQLKAVNKKGAC